MARITRDQILPGRVLHEDDDHITLEIGKHDGASFNIAPVIEGEPQEPPEFHTVLFVRATGDGGMEVWKPWEDGG